MLHLRTRGFTLMSIRSCCIRRRVYGETPETTPISCVCDALPVRIDTPQSFSVSFDALHGGVCVQGTHTVQNNSVTSNIL